MRSKWRSIMRLVSRVCSEAAFEQELADDVLVVALDEHLTLNLVHLGVDVELLVLSLEQGGLNVLSQILVELLLKEI